MEDHLPILQRFAGEVRTAAGFLNSKFKAIKMSTEEAIRCKSHIETCAGENGEIIPTQMLRPETPGNIRGLYRSVKKDVRRLRETFSSLVAELPNAVDLDQVDRVIQDLEHQLQLATTNLDRLRYIGPKTSRPKSMRRMKSARKSAKKILAIDDHEENPKENERTEIAEVLKETFTGTKRHISMPPVPVVSTKIKKPHQPRTSASAVERQNRNTKESLPTQKKRAWGAFHGHKTLSRDKYDAVPLPQAPDTTSLISSGSHESDKSRNNQDNNKGKVKKSHFNFTHVPNSVQSPRTLRDKKHLKSIRKTSATLNVGRKDGIFQMPGRKDPTQQGTITPMKKTNRDVTNLEKVDLNTQVDETIKTSQTQGTFSTMAGLATVDLRRPSYLVNRSKTIPETVLDKKNHIKKPMIGYPYGSSFPELPPLASLKRGCYPSPSTHTNKL